MWIDDRPVPANHESADSDHELQEFVYRVAPRLKPYPGHFRLLVTSLLRNLACLLALRLRAWLTSRKLIVIGLPEHMGDIVACTPFATWVRQQHPRSLIVWVARLPYHEVLRGNSNIDAVLSPYCITGWIWLKKFRRIYDQLYDLLIPLKVLREVSTRTHQGRRDCRYQCSKLLQFRFPSQRPLTVRRVFA